eukprot:COSAG01_NODE_22878_length_837_cov_1.040650_2_plen_101_part_01
METWRLYTPEQDQRDAWVAQIQLARRPVWLGVDDQNTGMPTSEEGGAMRGSSHEPSLQSTCSANSSVRGCVAAVRDAQQYIRCFGCLIVEGSKVSLYYLRP